MTEQTIIDRVRGLLAKAASTEFDAEREAFEAKAEELIARHMIDAADLDEAPEIIRHEYPVEKWGNASMGVVSLVAALARLHGAYAYYEPNGLRTVGYTVVLYATPDAIELITARLDYLLPQLRADVLRDRPRSRKSYALGWAKAVEDRLKVVSERVHADAGALVPTTTRAQEAMRKDNPFLQLGTRKHKAEVGDLAGGNHAGSQADLGGVKVGGRPELGGAA